MLQGGGMKEVYYRHFRRRVKEFLRKRKKTMESLDHEEKFGNEN
jgi:hypothetical protein